MRRLYFIIFVIGAVAGIGCSHGNNNSTPIPVPSTAATTTTTTNTVSQTCAAKDASGNCLGGTATAVTNASGIPGLPNAIPNPNAPGGPPGINGGIGTSTGIGQKLAAAIRTTYQPTGIGGGLTSKISTNPVNGGMNTTSTATNNDTIDSVAANNLQHFNSFVNHEDFTNVKNNNQIGNGGAGGTTGTGGHTDSGVGAGQ